MWGFEMLKRLLSSWRKKRTGPYTEHHENGQLWQKGFYYNGEMDGPFQSFYEDGQIEWNCFFSEDELDGPFESYHEDGQLESRGSYSNGEKCGEWIEENKTVSYPPCPTTNN